MQKRRGTRESKGILCVLGRNGLLLSGPEPMLNSSLSLDSDL